MSLIDGSYSGYKHECYSFHIYSINSIYLYDTSPSNHTILPWKKATYFSGNSVEAFDILDGYTDADKGKGITIS